MVAFAPLAGTLGTLRRRLGLERATLLAGLAAPAVATEALQRHLPDGTPAVADLAADLAGIGIGLACAHAASRLRHARRPAQRRFVMRLGADRRRTPRTGSSERRRSPGRGGRDRPAPAGRLDYLHRAPRRRRPLPAPR